MLIFFTFYFSFCSASGEKISQRCWADIFTQFSEKCPNILSLIDLVLSLSASSSECERGFSAMKLIKTDHRNRLKGSTLSNVMRIRLHSPSVSDFNPEEAIHVWNTSCHKRRPNHRPSSVMAALEASDTPSTENLELEEGANSGAMESLNTADQKVPEHIDSDVESIDSLYKSCNDSCSDFEDDSLSDN